MIQKLKDLVLSKDYEKMNPSEIASTLNVSNEDFKELVKAINQLEEEGLIHVSKEGNIFLASKLNIYQGRIKSVKIRKTAKCEIIKDDTIVEIDILAEDLNSAGFNDIVKVKLTSETTGTVLEVIKRNVWKIIAEYRNGDFISNNRNFYYLIKVINTKNFKLKNGTIVSLKINKYEERRVYCEIEEAIGHIDAPGIDVLSEILDSEVPYEFSKKILEECENIINKDTPDFDKRIDLTSKLIVTIDGDDAKDLDDAVSLEILDNGNYYLGVHIADVSHYVKENTLLDKEAFLRGTSVYLADRVIPMLPKELSNGICSLFENEIRLTISCFMEIDYLGNVINYDIKPSYIKSNARLTYHNVNCLFNHEPCDYNFTPEIKEMLFNMKTLSSILSKKMIEQGYLELDIDESKIIMDETNTNVVRIEKRIAGPAEKLIENFMILANETVASHIFYQQLPFIYRVHAAPSLDKMKTLGTVLKEAGIPFSDNKKLYNAKELQEVLKVVKGSDLEDTVSNIILRCLSKAVYSVNNIGHFGLGSKCYTHFTSPIRRYPDLLVHRYLRKYAFLNDFDNLDDNLQYLLVSAEQSSMCERRATVLERKVEDIKKAKYMEQFLGCSFDGIVTSVMDYGIYVKLDNTCEGFLPFSSVEEFAYLDSSYILSKLKVSSKIKVKLVSVNTRQGSINFALAKKSAIINNKGVKNNGKNHRRK